MFYHAVYGGIRISCLALIQCQIRNVLPSKSIGTRILRSLSMLSVVMFQFRKNNNT